MPRVAQATDEQQLARAIPPFALPIGSPLQAFSSYACIMLAEIAIPTALPGAVPGVGPSGDDFAYPRAAIRSAHG
jgi:hypothetical protein